MTGRRQLTPRQAELLEHVLLATLREHTRPYVGLEGYWQAIGLVYCAFQRWREKMATVGLMYQPPASMLDGVRFETVELTQLLLHVLFDLLAEEGHGKPRPEML